jgi:hypothetical protein
LRRDVIAVGLALALVTSCATAATLRFRSAAAFLLAAYVLLVAEIVLVVELLSIFGAVRRREVLALEGLLLAGAMIALVRRRASARVPLPRPRAASLDLRRHPALTVLLVAVVAALGYELALAVLTPPNNWDSMSYHLSRAAAWYQHHRVGYVAAHTERENVFAPNGEILILFTFVFAHGDRWAAAWQWLAEVACLIAIYTIGRRIGLDVLLLFLVCCYSPR